MRQLQTFIKQSDVVYFTMGYKKIRGVNFTVHIILNGIVRCTFAFIKPTIFLKNECILLCITNAYSDIKVACYFYFYLNKKTLLG